MFSGSQSTFSGNQSTFSSNQSPFSSNQNVFSGNVDKSINPIWFSYIINFCGDQINTCQELSSPVFEAAIVAYSSLLQISDPPDEITPVIFEHLNEFPVSVLKFILEGNYSYLLHHFIQIALTDSQNSDKFFEAICSQFTECESPDDIFYFTENSYDDLDENEISFASTTYAECGSLLALALCYLSDDENHKIGKKAFRLLCSLTIGLTSIFASNQLYSYPNIDEFSLFNVNNSEDSIDIKNIDDSSILIDNDK